MLMAASMTFGKHFKKGGEPHSRKWVENEAENLEKSLLGWREHPGRPISNGSVMRHGVVVADVHGITK
uniref:Uncharacterized protein n=1 Tax=Paenibacillus athensensis TaxID=1967502 RepID=A0A4Y8PZZ4_9BACL